MGRSSNPLHDVAIVGIYNTQQARRLPGETSLSLGLEALRGALDDAGMSPDAVDGVGTSFMEPHLTSYLMTAQFGGRPMWYAAPSRIGIALLADAALAISAGMCSTVALFGGGAGFLDRTAATGQAAAWTTPVEEWTEYLGLFTPAEFAMIATRQAHERGVKPEDAALVAATIRNNGSRTPKAVMYGRTEITVEDVLTSRPISSPLNLLDCCLTSEGGSALILTHVDRARDLPVKPVYLAGAGLECIDHGYHTIADWSRASNLGQNAADLAFRQAGLQRSDVSFCELYDPTSYEVIRQLEAFGFFTPGDAAPFIREGGIALEGALPICTNGGTMAFSHPGTAQMLQKLGAAAVQLQGRADANQLRDPRVALISNSGAGAYVNDVALLSREPL